MTDFTSLIQGVLGDKVKMFVNGQEKQNWNVSDCMGVNNWLILV